MVIILETIATVRGKAGDIVRSRTCGTRKANTVATRAADTRLCAYRNVKQTKQKPKERQTSRREYRIAVYACIVRVCARRRFLHYKIYVWVCVVDGFVERKVGERRDKPAAAAAAAWRTATGGKKSRGGSGEGRFLLLLSTAGVGLTANSSSSSSVKHGDASVRAPLRITCYRGRRRRQYRRC